MGPPRGELERSPGELSPVGAGRDAPALSWSSSPFLERIHRDFEEQVRAVEEVKRYLEDRLTPFHRHLAEQRRNIEQALKQLDERMRPLRQYLEAQEQNRERIGAALGSGLKEQFGTFERYLADQQRILQKAGRYLEEQPKPLQRYLEEQNKAVQLVFQDLEARLEPFARLLKEQQQHLATLAEPQINQEFEALANYLAERQQSLGRFATAPEYRPQELFADLEEIYKRYRDLDGGKHKLLWKILEQTRLADDRLKEALRTGPRELDEMGLPGDRGDA